MPGVGMSFGVGKHWMDMVVAGLVLMIVLLCVALIWGLLSAGQEAPQAAQSQSGVMAPGLHHQESARIKSTSKINVGTPFRTLRRSAGG